MKICLICKEEKGDDSFSQKRNQCKLCISRKGNKRIKERLLNNEIDQDTRIRMWVSSALSTPERKHLCKKMVFDLVKKALLKYPYMIFINKNKSKKYGHCARPNSASLDRIDPSKGYSENNIQIIPMWLNAAKFNCSIEYLIPYLKEFASRYEEFLNHFSLKSTD